MFDAIAGRYDFLNHLLSGGIDVWWRRRAIRSLALTGRERVLDLCTGTGDLALAARRAPAPAAHVLGIDFSPAMLRIARDKVRRRDHADRIGFVRGDATRIPIADAAVDAVTIAFGIRNVVDVAAACREMRRVLRRGGRIAVLEFAVPTRPIVGRAYLWYLRHVLPRIGRAVSRHDDAYGYLQSSIDAFATPDQLVATLASSGFTNICAVPLTFGSVYLYTADILVTS